MQELSDAARKAVLGEVLLDELKVIREYLEDVPFIKQKVISLDQRLERVESGMKIVKAVVKTHSRQIRVLERRTAHLA